MCRARSSHSLSIVSFVLALVLGAQMIGLRAAAAPQPRPRVAPGNPPFQRTWERTDQPVVSGAADRTWMWGPEANTAVIKEDYAESPGGKRDVQYFDKARMELTHPDAVDDGLWYVTNGLLVVELMTGLMQVGDASFQPRPPAVVNVAGDADDPTGPTYAGLANRRGDAPLPDGAPITWRVDRAGTVTNDPTLAAQGVTAAAYVAATNHRVASPFWTFMNSSGPVWVNGMLTTEPLFLNPFYATGYPVIEAYWAEVKVAGTYRLVLMQCFERRCLTYTPGNPAGFLTEAGNVGQHYHAWRYAPQADSLVINEVLPWPAEEAGLEWLELYNPNAAPVELTGWRLTNGNGSRSVALPAWMMPGGAYLVVIFGDGASDSDLSDGSGTYYAGAGSRPFFSVSDVALYDGAAGADTIVDFVAWSYDGTPLGGAAAGHAIAAGIWTAGAYFDASGNGAGAAYLLRTALAPGLTLGRDARSSDSDSPADWASAGGVDAAGASPGAVNLDESLELASAQAGPTPHVVVPPLAQKTWTLLVYMDARDPNVRPHWRREIKEMQTSGSDGSVNIVVQFATGDASGRYYIENGGKTYFPIPASNPGDPDDLAGFINWGTTNFPAEKYAIILAGHGDGWKGVLISAPDQDFLTMSELSTGLSALGQQFEMVRFYACLMSQAEVGYQIADQARFMNASQQITWTGFPWKAYLDGLKANTDWGGGDLSDNASFLITQQTEDQIFKYTRDPAQLAHQEGLKIYTTASIDLAVVESDVAPAVSALGAALRDDVEEYNQHDIVVDNDQIIIKHGALEPAKKMHDTNFLDLYHFAELVDTLPIDAASEAPPVMEAVEDAVRWESHGPGLANEDQHGLTIYFPHDLLLPDIADLCVAGGCGSQDSFDDPLFDPAEPLPTDGTHLYKEDATILIPRLRGVAHAMQDDPAFMFPADTAWDEFLHRYYKPVADACIRLERSCVSEVTVEVGTQLVLSGNGSSDSDHEEVSDDLPAHEPGLKHYYWDFFPDADHPDPRPMYFDDVLYNGCGVAPTPALEDDLDDCDRDEDDETDDDVDATGKLVDFVCLAPGDYPIRLMVWDEHHDFARERNERTSHNQGRHWLHFNVDDDWVLVHCGEPPPDEPIKLATEQASLGEFIEYSIELPANPQLTAPAEGMITDVLPAAFFLGTEPPVVAGLNCSFGECAYDPETATITWTGTLEPGSTLVLEFAVLVPVELTTIPQEITNTALVYDGAVQSTVSATTEIVADLSLQLSPGDASSGRRYY
jgi:hypothetical protein